MKSYFHDMRKISAELQIYMNENSVGRVLKDKCVRNQSEMALGKNKPCCYFCDIAVHSFLQVANCSTRCHELEIIIVKVKTLRAI